ncbi:MAG: substrate-binding domain-containing protein [Planctomycetales bacterium]
MRLVAACCLALCVSLSGCTPSTPPDTAPKPQSTPAKKLRLAVIPKGTSYEFWKSVHFGAERAAREAGNVEVFWKGPLRENDRDGQISVVEDFITQHVDGIALAPLDAQALVKYVAEAHADKIPTVIFDSALADESKIVSYVATDNYKGGVLAARRMGEVLGKKGNVILLRYTPGSESTAQREQGFLDTLQKELPKIKVISSNEYGGTSVDAALSVRSSCS